MRIIALIGSGRRKGNTARITQLVIEHLQRLAVEAASELDIETVPLCQAPIRQCQGCRVCFDHGETHCPLKDSLASIAQKMLEADGFIVASPVYVNDVSGLIKAWIDRLAYHCHRPGLTRHCALALATTASSPTFGALGTMTMALRTWGCHVAGQAGFKMGAHWPDEEMGQFNKRAESLAQRLFQAIHEKRYDRPGFLPLMTFAIQQRHYRSLTDDSLDLRYWREQGWLDRGCWYLGKPRTNPLVIWLARGFAALIGPLVS